MRFVVITTLNIPTKNWLGPFLFFVVMTTFSSVHAHHTGASQDIQKTTRFIDPFTGKREQPANYVVITQDYYKGTNENSNIANTTVFAEMPLAQGKFAINASVPYTYFDQKNRSDAARIGKTYLGGKYYPFFDTNKNYFIVFDGAVGFPSGNDTDRFTGGNYYTGSGFMTFGYLFGQWSVLVRGGGIQPLSRQYPTNVNDNDGIPYWLRPPASPTPATNYELKKTTIWTAYLTYYFKPELSFFVGFLFRTPYQGVDFDLRTKDRIPTVFRENSIGLSYNFSEQYTMSFTYRYPTTRRPSDLKLYEEAYTIAFSFQL